jgi:glutamate/tyrosine decarboxylase-like PLP-dependent enzyme
MSQDAEEPEETLDPADWEALRSLGHSMLDDAFEHMQRVRDRPVWQAPPEEARASFTAPLPQGGETAEAVYDQFKQLVLPYGLGNDHPRFWGWVMGTGTPLASLAEMLAAAMNAQLGGGNIIGTDVECQVIAWCAQMLGYTPEASGLLVSGGSMANLLALVVARHARSGFDVREEGLTGRELLTLYGSVEMHSSLQRAVEVLGLGNRALRRIPVDEQDRIDVGVLARTIAADLREGHRPICLIGNAGTVNTGAIDSLDTLADIARELGLWFHVDGAFGALAHLSPRLRPLLRGMDRADSLAFDLHKWGYLPFEAGCLLVRDREAHRGAFTLRPPYLKHADRGPAAGEVWFSDYGIQLTRGFRALKIWMELKHQGVEKLGRLIDQNVAQATYLAGLVLDAPDLELLAPVALNVVCFRYQAAGRDEPWLNRLNEELLIRLQESGLALPSGTWVRGRYAIRCAITNHRSRRDDFVLLVEAVRRLGAELLAEGWTG